MTRDKYKLICEELNEAVERMQQTNNKEELLFQMRSASKSVMDLYSVCADRVRGSQEHVVSHTLPMTPCNKCQSKARVVRASTPGYFFARCSKCENQSTKVFTTPRNAIIDWNTQQEGDTNV